MAYSEFAGNLRTDKRSKPQAKFSHEKVNYEQVSEHGSANCSRCDHFLAPASCTGVKSPISPKGYCDRYRRTP